ncbi:hypothetical protein LRB25_04825, partial [Borreliella burgdorferi]|nr:hypothetical protein [Borreliella burgdorferi]
QLPKISPLQMHHSLQKTTKSIQIKFQSLCYILDKVYCLSYPTPSKNAYSVYHSHSTTQISHAMRTPKI